MTFRHIKEFTVADGESLENSKHSAFAADVRVALMRSHALRDMLHQCVVAMYEHLDVSLAQIWTLSGDGDELELQASAGLHTAIDGPHARMPVGDTVFTLVARNGRIVLTNAIERSLVMSQADLSSFEGMVAFGGYPLRVDTQLVGVLAVFARTPLPAITFQTLGLIARPIACGIIRQRTLGTLERVWQELSNSRSFETIAQLAARRADEAADLAVEPLEDPAFLIEDLAPDHPEVRAQEVVSDWLLSSTRSGTRG